MTDESIHELERRWRATGHASDEAAYLVVRMRSDERTRAFVKLAADGGHDPARLAIGAEGPPRIASPEVLLSEAAHVDRAVANRAVLTVVVEAAIARAEEFRGGDCSSIRLAAQQSLDRGGQVDHELAVLERVATAPEVKEACAFARDCIGTLGPMATFDTALSALSVVLSWLRNPDAVSPVLAAELLTCSLGQPFKARQRLKALRLAATITVSSRSFASDPGRLRPSPAKVDALAPELYAPRSTLQRMWDDFLGGQGPSWHVILEEHLKHGDSRAAVVIVSDPQVVAAYTDELDCVALLEVPALPGVQRFDRGARLLTVNTYTTRFWLAKDLWNGPRSTGRMANMIPFIGDLLSDSEERLRARKHEIDETEWQRCEALGRLLWNSGQKPRSARPDRADKPRGRLAVSRAQLAEAYEALGG